MNGYSLPEFDSLRSMIETMRKNNKEWSTIKYAGGKNEAELTLFLENFKSMGIVPDYTTDEIWMGIVEWSKKTEEEEIEIRKSGDRTILISKEADNEAKIPGHAKSSWQLYRKKLQNENWSEESIKEIETATHGVLKKLNQDTTSDGPVKGLIIGNVQSGKTANMAGLMAMAADHGWNMFIVLSGLIDNLRKQTEERLISDLNHPGTLSWQGMDNPSKRPSITSHTQNMHLGEGFRNRYLTVCLKNKTRLENLIRWLYMDENKLRQMKILIIDDEADQAGINTFDIDKEERARINGLILELVNGKNDTDVKPKAMNYISYTATPYANVLNEVSEESLYPKDFIGLLKTPKEYFGPKEIFGLFESDDFAGLDIIREISDDELDEVVEIHKGRSSEIPDALKKAVIWFFCAAAVQRYRKYKKPVSMLIHTSQGQAHHRELSESVEQWISGIDEKELLIRASKLYFEETARFSKEDFYAGYPDYGISEDKLNDYPLFEDIEGYITDLKKKISHIELDQEGELSYHGGTHLCIDNCASNGWSDDNVYVRLAYPEKGNPRVETDAPAFIIVGGSTLSRGLTIEGLVSTFFLRSTKQADTLMQMGRWFGYRKGYELLPRIWMTEDTQNKFRFLASLEHEMREDLKPFEMGEKPSKVGPRIKNSPQLSWLKITAKNRMQNAIETELDFSGISNQTVVFRDDSELLRSNITVTEEFLNSIGEPVPTYDKAGLLWRNVPFKTIGSKFLKQFNFESSPVFDQLDAFTEWFEKIQNEEGFTGWNVIVSGRGKVDEEQENEWNLNGYSVGKVTRTRKGKFSKEGKRVSIGVLRNPSDLYRDMSREQLADLGVETDSQINNLSKNMEEVHRQRALVGLEKTAQLIIYRIDKGSEARKNTNSGNADTVNENSQRYDLEFSEDIIGISILIPGKKNKSLARKLTVDLRNFNEEEAEGE